MTDNNWTIEKETMLVDWSIKCDISSWHHSYNSEYYNKLDKWLSIPSIFISAITSTAILSSLGVDDNTYIIICFGVLLIIGTILQSMRDFLTINSSIHNNSNSSKLYQLLINDIESQLNLTRMEREDGVKFISRIKLKNNEIFLNSPSIDNKNWIIFKQSIEAGNYMKLRNPQQVMQYIMYDNTTITTDNIKIKIDNDLDTDDNLKTPTDCTELHELNLSIDVLKQKLTFF
tara:strand:- start:61 stop:753 length:693 start_codon:yes stop_codon:yes gene_type:complete